MNAGTKCLVNEALVVYKIVCNPCFVSLSRNGMGNKYQYFVSYLSLIIAVHAN